MNNKARLTFLDKIMMAVTFAEAGEHQTARQIINQTKQKQHRPENQDEKRPVIAL